MNKIHVFNEETPEASIDSKKIDPSFIEYDNAIDQKFNDYTLLTPRKYSELGFYSLYAGDESKKIMASFHAEKDSPDNRLLEEQLRIINKRFNFVMKNKIIDLYGSRRIMLIDNKEVFNSIMSSLICWKLANSNGMYVAINATPYFTNSIENIDTKTLFGLMSWGSMVYLSHVKWAKLTVNTPISQNLSYIYANLFYRVIDNITGIGIVKARKEFVFYVLSKYFLIYLMGRAPSMVVNGMAYKNLEILSRHDSSAPTSLTNLESEEYRLGQFAEMPNQLGLYRLNFPKFIQALSKFEWAIGKLNSRSFLAKAVTSYNQKILLCIEDLGHFIGAMVSHQAASELVTSYNIEHSFSRFGPETISLLSQIYNN